ncbi:hypothetical protein ASPWEDRAFT_46812 [Aspergillus wentii DTO 134E9]|uniref:Uncharacterized protein n=1 Tax=Aspergillus wentii DTO 134E9 TaxID=1073089 RepID=A0A1L9R420_ASPWE|nr:uncharacterized protein ASPWEDRAFT_46812 [Aspergillus wentii DTO 134E9]KAI9923458.1 hypothetical protein MW887_009297 [Aspergillus wentii]OJJ29623.1 hypothetical protein ASPWEDRAFT_46812 [Aspergillus wentii DTO 134E9]
MPLYSALLQCLGRRSKDLTAFTGDMPPFEAKIESTRYINGVDPIIENGTILETKCIGAKGDYNTDQNMNAEAKGIEPYSESVSDQATLAESTIAETERPGLHRESDQATVVEFYTNAETKGVKPCCDSVYDQNTTAMNTDTRTKCLELCCQGTIFGDDHIFPSPSFVDKLTGERMVELIHVTTISLDHCKIKGAGSSTPDSDKDEIEVLFHCAGENVWVHVPYSYAKDRDDFK